MLLALARARARPALARAARLLSTGDDRVLHTRPLRSGAELPDAPAGRHATTLRKALDITKIEGSITFAEYRPDRVALWHPSKNAPGLSPFRVSFQSHETAWFKCPVADDHEWSTTVSSAAAAAQPCPFCLGTRASATNSVAATAPAAAALWHPTRNEPGCTPETVVARSTRKAWFKCPHGADHEFEAVVRSVALDGHGCPFCADRRVSETNSVAARFPQAAADWHPTLNDGVTAHDVVGRMATKQYWFRCPEGHELRMSLRARLSVQECPTCHRRGNSLDNCLPELLATVRAEFAGPAPAGAAPDGAQLGTATDVEEALDGDVPWEARYRWRCRSEACGHEWDATLYNRLALGTQCPLCSGREASRGRSLEANFPRLVDEWHPSRNGALTPADVSYGSKQKVWWRCSRDAAHEWQTSVNKRTNLGRDCPQCAGVVASATNNVAVVTPHLARFWHPTKNGEQGPEDTLPGSTKPVWWKCPAGPDHEWQDTPASRKRARHICPFCIGRRASVTNSVAAHFPDVERFWSAADNDGKLATEVHMSVKSDKKYTLRCPQCDRVWQDSNRARSRRKQRRGCVGCGYS